MAMIDNREPDEGMEPPKAKTLNRPKTVIMDIDGCLVKHMGNLTKVLHTEHELLDGVLEKFNEWDAKNYQIILFTGRRESTRDRTEAELKRLGLFWDRLLMGIGSGQRVLVNDLKPNCEENTAVAFNLTRNEGISSVNI